MKALILLLLVWLVQLSSAKPVPTAATRSATRRSRFVRVVDKIFDDADSNKDGSVSFSEVYEMVLKLYIVINQQAPIKPPSKARVVQLFLDADTTRNNRLNREEFQALAETFGRRVLSRLVAHKFVTLLGAPLLAEYVVRTLAPKTWTGKLANKIVVKRFQKKVLPIITSRSFWRGVLLIMFVASLGNIVLSTVTWVLDMSLPDEETDKRLKKFLK